MNQFNAIWKYLVETYFSDFINFFFPGVAYQIDLKGNIRVLHQEADYLVPYSDDPYSCADILLKAPKKEAKRDTLNPNSFTIIHVAVQGREKLGFTEKLFRSTYRIYDRFHKLPISLVICTDDDPKFYPAAFEIIDTNRYLRLEFNVAKLLYFRERVHDPDCYSNLFSFISYFQLEVNRLMRENKHDIIVQLKGHLLSELFSYPLPGDYKSSLIEFLDWILPLSDIQEEQLETGLSKKNLMLYYSLRRNHEN